ANGITPESVKSRISDILNSVYERDHVRADISAVTKDGQMVGANLKVHLQHLEKEMRDAAADLDFERAARLRDELKRLREAELAISDDPLAREVEAESPVSGREKGKHNKGRARHRTADEISLFKKPDLDNMGPGTDMVKPARAAPSLFRRNDLDEMTVRRTEKPVAGKAPAKPEDVRPIVRGKVGAGSYEDPADAKRQKRRPGKTGRPGR
ncbi:UvrB/UvrC motif-containing protein, partial [Shinella sp.]|uniref:UvrB/UvrC motif-containing protein n=1 Tax=Shinella sp. TaxID=1870904 RepID=UPI003F7302CD